MAAADAPASPHVVMRWAKGFVDLCGLKFQYRPRTRTQLHLRPFLWKRIRERRLGDGARSLPEDETQAVQTKRFLNAGFSNHLAQWPE